MEQSELIKGSYSPLKLVLKSFLHFVILSLNGCKTQPSFNFSNIVNSCNFLQI